MRRPGPRASGGHRRPPVAGRATLGRAALAGALCLAGSWALALSYTVQVVALSDWQAALDLVRQLSRDGFPAYSVRASTAQGAVFRVRVGAFGNRAAAVSYAEAMAGAAGTAPVPALSEDIPPGIMPLEPSLVASVDLTAEDWALLPWNDGVALRVQGVEPLTEARYYPSADTTPEEAGGEGAGEGAGGGVPIGDPAPLAAWLAVPEPDGAVLRVRSLSLWPPNWRDEPEEVRGAYRASLLALVAESLALDEASVAAASAEGPDGAPQLIVLERSRPAAPGEGELLGLADPAGGFDARGPRRWLRGGEALPTPVTPLFGPGDAPEGATDLGGRGWQATADGGFTSLLLDGGSSWRAVVGEPLWAGGDHLLTRWRDTLLLFVLRER